MVIFIDKQERLTIKSHLCDDHHVRVMETMVDMRVAVIQKWSRFPALLSMFPHGSTSIFKIALPNFKTPVIFLLVAYVEPIVNFLTIILINYWSVVVVFAIENEISS